MSKAGLFLHTTINFDEVAAALDYGQRTLDHATYAKVTNAFKKMIFHCLLWIFISIIICCGTVLLSHHIQNLKTNELLTAYNATTFKGGVRTSPTTVLYTEGGSYQYDVSGLGLNLDTDFPHQRALTLLLDDQNQLKGVISNDESNKITDIFAFGLVFGMIEIAVIMIVYAFFVRKHTSYGKKWYAFMKWFEIRDDTLLDIIRE